MHLDDLAVEAPAPLRDPEHHPDPVHVPQEQAVVAHAHAVERARQDGGEAGVGVVVGREGEEDGGEGEHAEVERGRHRLQRQQLEGLDRRQEVELGIQLLRTTITELRKSLCKSC